MPRHLVALLLLAFPLCTQATATGVIPQPERIEAGRGSFALGPNVRIVAPADRRAQEIAAFLRDGIREDSGIALRIGAATRQPRIELRTDPSVQGEEAYRLTVTPQRVEIASADDRGLFWGVQTLRQLLPPGHHATLAIAAVRIDDAPRYAWRGVMLDAARHFIPVALVKQQIDLLSRYKLNVLHWHLTDDQGWRIEIRKYPRLTSVGAWRTEADGSRSGGFYTRQDIRDIVEYARQRNVMIVPEIEMPGHASAAVAAYPSLSCPQQPIVVPATWGVFTDIYCAGDEASFTFLHDVLSEVAELFPAPYIHIGGDEVPKQQWAQSASSQQRMRDEHLAGVDALQSWFVQRIQRDLEARGKTLVGWDEILEGGADRNAIVEMWRGDAEAAKALANGNRLIVAGPFYLDTPIEELTTQDIYRINPFASPAFAGHQDQVLGAEAPLWSEYVTPRNLEAMLYPRVIALAERLWNPDANDYADFQQRLRTQYPWLDAQHIAYGPEDRDLVDYKLDYNPLQHRWRVRAARGFDDIALHYTVDGSEPTSQSPAFGDVLDRYVPATLKIAPFRHGVPYLPSQTFQSVDNKALGKPINYLTAPDPHYAGTATQLVDGVIGDDDFNDGLWVGWRGSDLDATLDLQPVTPFHTIQMRFLQQSGSWALLPRRVTFAVSDDGKTWRTLQSTPIAVDPMDLRAMIRTVRFEAATPVTARYLRVTAQNYGVLPPGHEGAGKPAHLFTDEILVQ
ncbi:glycoside hydrolase family 20 protein [Rhodanobacter spathiphylli]|uniref:beta-N-acetylhexosaminidase n=1 Tax=Rhodanobacter spathiphylli B39 TaxID=1163407 RepID=I4VRX4_9GAMM|nr:family 20 glycosylhydrolase [Rhodanobacter spathiphylli]EIL89965.1 N-acetyl-beta-hexosaminidase [Rhodanobacter spathiphylli B39]